MDTDTWGWCHGGQVTLPVHGVMDRPLAMFAYPNHRLLVCSYSIYHGKTYGLHLLNGRFTIMPTLTANDDLGS